MKRRLLSLAVACLLLLSALCGCGSRSTPPELYEIYDEAVALIEASFTVNDALLGHGLPVYRIDSEYAKIHGLYADNDFANYEHVTPESPYRTIDDIKTAMAAVYSADYCESLYANLFDGFVSGSTFVRAQYREDAKGLYLVTDYKPLVTGQRVYDYATMKIVEPSSLDYVNLEIESYLPGETERLNVTISLVLEEDGWRLDTPTY